MKLAIMQPYFFPYLGYFQLMAAVDRFVLLDDVAFINRGWINRNRILVSGKEQLVTVPLRQASQNRLIRDIEVCEEPPWREKFLKTLQQAYRRAPFFASAYACVEETLRTPSRDIGSLASASLQAVATHLGIQTFVVRSSSVYENAALKGSERILDICRREGADEYFNAPGGRALYRAEDFRDRGMELHFVQPAPFRYSQLGGGDFVPWLSIIDVLMFNSPEAVAEQLSRFELQ
jgi:hypothetical protein